MAVPPGGSRRRPDEPTAVAGCGTTTLRALDDRLPWLGRVFALAVAGADARGVALSTIGASRERSGALRLPFPLDGLGMTGCTPWVSPDVVLPLLLDGRGDPRARLRVPLGPCPARLGCAFFVQVFAPWSPARTWPACPRATR